MKRSIIMMLVLITTLSASSQKKWSLKDCIDYAMQNNITLQQARLQ